jgi:hypothetical protein
MGFVDSPISGANVEVMKYSIIILEIRPRLFFDCFQPEEFKMKLESFVYRFSEICVRYTTALIARLSDSPHVHSCPAFECE